MFCKICKLMEEYCGKLDENGICDDCMQTAKDAEVDTQDEIELTSVMDITDRGVWYGQRS